jgi:hypothetical protein
MSQTDPSPPAATGGFAFFDGEACYRITDYDAMSPFLMSLASDTDIWMYISSAGGLTAGRVDVDGGLFPYETEDKLHVAHHHTGPITLFRVRRRSEPATLWQPFSERSAGDFQIDRNLYKNAIGNRLFFEEVNHDLKLVFRYRWSGCDAFGMVRTAALLNRDERACAIDMLDGLRNVLPYGAPLALYQQMSSLVDAYKRVDCDPDTRLGIFSLTSKIVDRAEAAEELKANTIWSCGLTDFGVCLSKDAIDAFRRGDPVQPENTLTGRRGNYFVVSSFELAPDVPAKWHIAADIGQDHLRVAALRARLLNQRDLPEEIENHLRTASDNLLRNVGSADGLQLTGQPESDVHHFANVLFNNMRGGVFAEHYNLSTADLCDFIQTRNRSVANRRKDDLAKLAAGITVTDLLAEAAASQDADYERLCHEYLPIYFSRRHGDPSRPWNQFAIRVKNSDGSRALRYEGNWRDIFQNWEALGQSFPGFLPSIITKFVNASTVDGFNPYRITRDGVDWEVVDPEDPWSYIGYWGDHQIIYLLKFLEALRRFSPKALTNLLDREIFCYTDVPYRLKPYEDIVADPRVTIDFDGELASRIEDRVAALGTDGKLLPDKDGSIYHINLFEKLLVPALSKLSNLVPDGGIWMNTQRPEWNDANNALVGNGVSMVTLCYLRRYLEFFSQLLDDFGGQALQVSREVAEWHEKLRSIFDEHRALLHTDTLSDRDRKVILDAVGLAFSEYRRKVYDGGFSGMTTISVLDVAGFCRQALGYLDHAIRANRRSDGLYNSYNIIQITNDGEDATIRPLYEMLEGQVAVLSSGVIDAVEAAELLSNLFASRMYRADQQSFLLYPERELPGFLEKNTVPEKKAGAVRLLRELVAKGDRSILSRDVSGVFRFNGSFQNALDLDRALERLAKQKRWAGLVATDRQAVLDLFEVVFNHTSFTGRSGTMYGYEGLGCIYWHMVSKLLLAVQEITLRAADDGDSAQIFGALAKMYYRIRSGLGFEKPVTEYGAFPTDPYSHTPPHSGARQPGMTGQVKEEILTRLGELGVRVEDGALSFRPVLLRHRDFRKDAGTYRFIDLGGVPLSVDIPAGSLAFTFCQVPVIYELTQNDRWIRITGNDGTSSVFSGERLDKDHSRAVFARRSGIARIDVGLPEQSLINIGKPV